APPPPEGRRRLHLRPPLPFGALRGDDARRRRPPHPRRPIGDRLLLTLVHSRAMRVLVTGHNGYIGGIMVPLLKEAGHEVVGLDTDFFEPCLLPGQPVDLAVPEIRKDLRDVEASDLEGFEAVLHLAGLSNDPLGNL